MTDHTGEPDTRRRILDAAERHFAEKGFSGTSVRDIVQSANVTNPMLYYYFGSKEELLRELVSVRCEEAERSLERELDRCQSAPDVMRCVALRMVEDARERGGTVRLLLALLLTDHAGDVRTRVAEHGLFVRSALGRALMRIDDSLHPETVDQVVQLFHFGLAGALLAHVARAGSEQEESLELFLQSTHQFTRLLNIQWPDDHGEP
ncbi:MAG: TetR/AcrR family transcriptional regulator [Deltaproteobacteria bacterium]|nr:MAG: TetR/AcrR family transcriptional regulator [Deltaproteobacteria bacterium]